MREIQGRRVSNSEGGPDAAGRLRYAGPIVLKFCGVRCEDTLLDEGTVYEME